MKIQAKTKRWDRQIIKYFLNKQCHRSLWEIILLLTANVTHIECQLGKFNNKIISYNMNVRKHVLCKLQLTTGRQTFCNNELASWIKVHTIVIFSDNAKSDLIYKCVCVCAVCNIPLQMSLSVSHVIDYYYNAFQSF